MTSGDTVALPKYKEIIDLIKTGATIEAQEKIMELRQSALELQEANVELRERIIELEARVKELEHADGESCPRCKKRTWVVVSSKPDPIFGDMGGTRRTYKCEECGLTESKLFTGK
jgi:DNA-binding transcriptional MerR regulator